MASLNTPATSKVKDTIEDLFITKKYSDLGIYCRGKFWDVHQAIVCMRSTVLEEFCTKSGRQSQGKLHIDLSDYESGVLEAVLSFMYLDHYVAGDEEGVVFHTKVFIAACKFEMSGLSSLAVLKYQDAVGDLSGQWEQYFCAAAGILWEELSVVSEGSVLKTVVIEVARERVSGLFGSKGGEFKALGLQKPEIGMAVLEAVVRSKLTDAFGVEVEEVIEVVDVVDGGSVGTVSHIAHTKENIEISSDVPIEVPRAEDAWMNWGQTAPVVSEEKEKMVEEPIIEVPALETVAEPECSADGGWGSLSTKKTGKIKTGKMKTDKIKTDKKKKGKGLVLDKEPILEQVVLEELSM